MQVGRVRYPPLGSIDDEGKMDEWFDYLIHSTLGKCYPNEQAAFWAGQTVCHIVTELVIFPGFLAVFKSEQLQSTWADVDETTEEEEAVARRQENNGPQLVCSFSADFDDYLQVQTDFYSIMLFLPTLWKEYEGKAIRVRSSHSLCSLLCTSLHKRFSFLSFLRFCWATSSKFGNEKLTPRISSMSFLWTPSASCPELSVVGLTSRDGI